MGAKVVEIVLPTGKSAKILKWKVKEGTIVSIGRVILLYDINPNNGKEEQKKLKATQVGTVRKLLAKEGEIVHPGDVLLELEECTHPTVMKDMCAECGADLRKEECVLQNASIPMVHSIPELKVSKEQAQILGKADEERLLKDRKLVLLVDLDQTLIHTTNDNIPPNLKDVYHFRLYGPGSPWYHTRLRPGTQKFLNEMSRYYELHICTFGARNYAHMIALFLDQDGKFFSHRILSRDECFNPNSKTANLTALFPCGDNLVCIIDDREDVWNFAPNLVHVKPYHFFQHTGDINAPPGLAKCENDDKEGFDFTKMSDVKEKESVKCKVKENGEMKTSEKQEKESEQCDSEKSEESKIGADACVMQETVALSGEEAAERTGGEQNTEVEVETSAAVKDSEPREDTNVDESPAGDLTGDLEISDEEASQQNKADKSSNGTTEEKLTEPSSGEGGCEKEASGGKEENKGGGTVSVGKEGGEEDLIEVEDGDDYLLYLEEILKTVHKAFYQLYDELDGKVPDLKVVIPYVRLKVLAGTSLVFSGLVPTHTPLEKSRAYQVARSMGAQVTQDLTSETTHLVAVRPGTAKVNAARRAGRNIFIVTPDWLWCCGERWEKVDERLYPLVRGGSANRHPPAHCGSPEHVSSHQQPAARQRTPSGRFMDTINPLMSFSSEDIANMDREVEDIFNESESEGEQEKTEPQQPPVVKQKLQNTESGDESSSSSADSLSCEHPHGWGKKGPTKRKRIGAGTATESDGEEDDEEDDMPSAKFRRGEALPSDLDLGEEEDSCGSDEPPDDIDDGDWNMMGAALEREFLSGNGD
ncbi:RNA polymerase II subunit A C-terminal domain phosphatase isoform X1 [Periplaneta americana]|uniref:RNA polymerase II subunit A C-terminal domain phosphatase isoform X1 n=1 Tax=Periplaneta americana TaxID=6978 RepID=UPI0037E71DBE